MRERQTFLKWTCGRDVLDDGTLITWIDALEDEMEQAFAQWKFLGRPGKPNPWTIESRMDQLDALVGGGINQEFRVRLTAAPNDVGIEYINIQATLHPYTGRYVTACELRLRNDIFTEQAAVEQWSERLQQWAHEGAALSAQMHEADDDAIQNVSNAGVLRLGYGIDFENVDVSKNPGRETSRGEYRYVVNWLSFYSEDMLKALGNPTIEVNGVTTWEKDAGLWVKLSDSPQNPDDPIVRERQRLVRAQLGIEKLAKKQQRSFGFWQKK